MQQPELGIKIDELRKAKGITQKELSEICHIDIRTVQRIIAGEVNPRISTLRLMAEYFQQNLLSEADADAGSSKFSNLFLIAFVSGIIHLLCYFLHTPLIPKLYMLIGGALSFGISILYLVTGAIFYYGLYSIAKHNKNSLLQVGIFISVCLMILFGLLNFLIDLNFPAVNHLMLILTVVLGLNCVIFGIGLLLSKGQNAILYRLAGILQLVASPFFIIPNLTLNFIGIWLSLPFTMLLLGIVYAGYRHEVSLKRV